MDPPMMQIRDIFSTVSPPQETLAQIVTVKNVFLAAISMLVLDHLLTLSLEIEYVWKRQKSFPLWLFVAIRYYALAALSIVAMGFFAPAISGNVCQHWAQFLPLGITMPLSIGPSCLLILRVYAMYGRSKYILFGLGTILCAQFAAGLWQYTVKGGSYSPDPINNYDFHYCVYLPPKSLGSVASMYVFIELSFNTLLFLLTVGRAFFVFYRQRGMRNPSSLMTALAANGTMYYGVIFCSNLSWAIEILTAPTGLRAASSMLTSALTTIMMSRITLNLRSSASQTVTYANPPSAISGYRIGKTTNAGDIYSVEADGSGSSYPLEVISNKSPIQSRFSDTGLSPGKGGQPNSVRGYGYNFFEPPPSPMSASPGMTPHTERAFVDFD